MVFKVVNSYSLKTFFLKAFLVFQVFPELSMTALYVFLIFIAHCCAGKKFYSGWFKFISIFCWGDAIKQLWCHPVQIKNKLMFWHLMDFLFNIFSAVIIQIDDTSAIHNVQCPQWYRGQYPLCIVHNVKQI